MQITKATDMHKISLSIHEGPAALAPARQSLVGAPRPSSASPRSHRVGNAMSNVTALMGRQRVQITFVLLLGVLAACQRSPRYRAEVDLKVAGQPVKYSSQAAQLDFGGGPDKPSLYFLRDKTDGAASSLSLRSYQGQAVAKLWLMYQADDDSEPRRYECFVPGKLDDGRPTLTWTKDNGDKRETNETGQADCQVKITQDPQQISLEINATLRQALAGKNKALSAKAQAEADATQEAGLRVTGTARLLRK